MTGAGGRDPPQARIRDRPSLEVVQRALRGQGNPCPECLSRNAPSADRCRSCGRALPSGYAPDAPEWDRLPGQIERGRAGRLRGQGVGLGLIFAGGSLALLLSGWAGASVAREDLLFGGISGLAVLGVAVYWAARTRSRELSSLQHALKARQRGSA